MRPLTEQQTDCLDYIAGYINGSGGVSPTTREIAAAMGRSLGWVQKTLNLLVIAGRVRRLENRPRSLSVITQSPAPSAPSLRSTLRMFADIDRVRGIEPDEARA